MPKFTRTQSFTKTNIADIPKNKAIVYKLKNSTGNDVYVGIAGRGRSQERLLEHKMFKKDAIPGATKFQYAQVKNKTRAAKIEKQIIRKEEPKFNVQYKYK